jgi:hypothetical protein
VPARWRDGEGRALEAVSGGGGGGAQFGYLLQQKVAELRTAAIENFMRYNPVKFDSNGAVVLDLERLDGWSTTPTGGWPRSRLTDGDHLTEYYRFMELVDALAARFEPYYDLGSSLELTSIITKLDDEWSTDVDWDDPALDLSEAIERDSITEAPRNAHDRLHFAYFHWVRPVEGMIVPEMWDGDAARTFLEEFIEPFQRAKSMQAECVKVLATAAEALRRGVVELQRDLVAIAEACTATLNEEAASDSGQSFGIASILTGAIGLFFPPASYLSLGLGIADLFAEGSADVAADTWVIEGNGVDEGTHQIILSTFDVIAKMESTLYAQDLKIGRALGRAVESPDGFRNPGLRVSRPDIAKDPGAFGERYGEPTDDPSSLEFRLVTTRIPQLYEAGYQKLPGAAEVYGEAVTEMRAAVVPDWLPKFFIASTTHFEEARTIVTSRLEHTRDDLIDSGESLVQAAQDYELTDDESAVILRQFEEILPHEEYLESEEYAQELEAQGLEVEPGWSREYEPSVPPLPVDGESAYH